ncbi:MAG: aminoglycoside phosphotransferase family protein [Flavitalea sp.]
MISPGQKIDFYLKNWSLTADGDVLLRRSGIILPVIQNGMRGILKIATTREEQSGARLMVYWNGTGAARVLEFDGDALLIERASGTRSLMQLVLDNKDDEATEIICEVVSELHKPRIGLAPGLVPLAERFNSLFALHAGGMFDQCVRSAEMLLQHPRDIVLLHGDIHHGNILDFDERGWLAIDPKGMVGDRSFDYANIFCNPNLEVAVDRGRFEQRVTTVCKITGIERDRLLHWIVAWAGLSAAWHIEDGESEDVEGVLTVAEIALSVANHLKI